jgi:hypothetical protein
MYENNNCKCPGCGRCMVCGRPYEYPYWSWEHGYRYYPHITYTSKVSGTTTTHVADSPSNERGLNAQ